MANTTSLVTLSKKIYDVLRDEQAELGLEDVFFGDQYNIPKSPATCVEPVGKRKELQGARRYCLVTLQVGVLLYHSRVQDDQITREEADTFAEAIEAKLDGYTDGINASGTLGGLVIHGFIPTFESGYTTRAGVDFRSVRMIYEATIKQLL